jgi:hypothetical protein
VGVHGKVVETTVCETVAVVSGILDLCDQAILGEGRDVPVNGTSATLTRELLDERRRDDFMVFAALLDLFIALACVSRKYVRTIEVVVGT